MFPVHATGGSLITGDTFTGSGTQQCGMDPIEPFTIKVSITSFASENAQNTHGNFAGTAIAAFAEGPTSFSKFNATLQNGNILNGQFNNDEPGTGTFAGSLDADGKLTISYMGTEPGCMAGFLGNFTAFKNVLGALSSGEKATASDEPAKVPVPGSSLLNCPRQHLPGGE